MEECSPFTSFSLLVLFFSAEAMAISNTMTSKINRICMNVLLELHLDRMCIWHAVTMEETSAADTAKTSSFSGNHLSGKKVESDAVRDFCTEVIIPQLQVPRGVIYSKIVSS
jgi:hypothetical protein